MNVNVSGRQVAEPGFVAEVAAILSETGMDPTRLVLEFTEGVLIQDTDATMATLQALKSLGVRLAIDDFGTGYSSLSYVRQFPIDILKIDRSFVASMADGPDETALLHSILQLSETLHLETVAEGIEDAGQLAELQTPRRRPGAGLPVRPSARIGRDLGAPRGPRRAGWTTPRSTVGWPRSQGLSRRVATRLQRGGGAYELDGGQAAVTVTQASGASGTWSPAVAPALICWDAPRTATVGGQPRASNRTVRAMVATGDGGGAREVGSGQLAAGVLVDQGRAEAAARDERERRGVVGSPVSVGVEIE